MKYIFITLILLAKLSVLDAEDSQASIELPLSVQNCEFKIHHNNGMYNREGAFPIDVLAETFACDLQSSGIDTLMLIKHFSGQDDEEFVLWIDSGAMYMKSFGINGNGACENDVVLYDWSSILTYYFEEEVYLEHELPHTGCRCSMSEAISVQFRCGDDHFYNQFLKGQYYDLNFVDDNNKMVIFFDMIYREFIGNGINFFIFIRY